MMEAYLEKLKNILPWGFAETIAEKTGVSKSTVYKVLDGERKNIKVLNAAIDLARTHTQKNNDAIKLINQL